MSHAPQDASVSRTLAEQSFETPLRELVLKPPVGVAADTPLARALGLMQEHGIGSVVVLDAAGGACGILTRHDIVGRVTLPGLPLQTPISQVMSAPVQVIDSARTAHDASLAMSRHGIRHLPVVDGARVIGIVSERDLFALQRLSLEHVSSSIRRADDLPALQAAAREIRRFARSLLGQDVGARRLTELISHLNDLLTERLLRLIAAEQQVELDNACWLAFGSEGRAEQTIATDQDNGLVFDSAEPKRDRPALLAFALRVNHALDACGYPLCRGNVMASNPECCLTRDEWCHRFEGWIEQGAPRDLLDASIYFDFRPLAGRADLAQPMRDLVTRRARALPRFVKQMADNALGHRAPLAWHGGIAGARVDLKMQGTAIFVDAARLYALAHGVAQTNTRARFEALAPLMHAPPAEAQGWIAGFEFLQMLRLRTQIDDGEARANPNLLELATLNDIDRRTLKESLRVAHRLQQRMELDYHSR
jgi:CBS domain-containing protein